MKGTDEVEITAVKDREIFILLCFIAEILDMSPYLGEQLPRYDAVDKIMRHYFFLEHLILVFLYNQSTRKLPN